MSFVCFVSVFFFFGVYLYLSVDSKIFKEMYICYIACKKNIYRQAEFIFFQSIIIILESITVFSMHFKFKFRSSGNKYF